MSTQGTVCMIGLERHSGRLLYLHKCKDAISNLCCIFLKMGAIARFDAHKALQIISYLWRFSVEGKLTSVSTLRSCSSKRFNDTATTPGTFSTEYLPRRTKMQSNERQEKACANGRNSHEQRFLLFVCAWKHTQILFSDALLSTILCEIKS